MPKKRKQKPVPEHLKRIEPVPPVDLLQLDGDERMAAAKASFTWHNETIRKRRLWLEVWRKEYQSGGDPLAVWDAYLTVREMRWEVPEWILEYFAQVANGLLSPKSKLENIPLCLGFDAKGGGPGEFEQYRAKEIRRYAVAWVLNDLQEHLGWSIDDACKSAVEAINERYGTEYDQDSVKKWYYKTKGDVT